MKNGQIIADLFFSSLQICSSVALSKVWKMVSKAHKTTINKTCSVKYLPYLIRPNPHKENRQLVCNTQGMMGPWDNYRSCGKVIC